MPRIPGSFVNMMTQEPHFDIGAFQKVIETDSPTSIRVNLRKNYTCPGSEFVPWCSHACYLDERPIFTLDPLFHAGCYYVQEASSMFLWQVLNHVLDGITDPQILDMSAAPGGKTTLIMDYLSDKGTLVANEVIQSRASILYQNTTKWSGTNVIVTSADPSKFDGIESTFDLLVIDAPCSGEGMWRKDNDAINEWSPDHVELCSARQKRIISDSISLVKPGGYLFYSTCTYNSKENIDNVNWMMQEYNLESVELPLNQDWDVQIISKNKGVGYQFLPYKLKGEGFFCSVLRKLDSNDNVKKASLGKISLASKEDKKLISEWVANQAKDLKMIKSPKEDCYLTNECSMAMFEKLQAKMRVLGTGIKIGRINKKLFLPDHALALSTMVSDDIPKIELSKDDSLDYLRKQLDGSLSYQKSWNLVQYQGYGLGWIKQLDHRINNYLPQEYMIKHL